jgi:hypothetical protein
MQKLLTEFVNIAQKTLSTWVEGMPWTALAAENYHRESINELNAARQRMLAAGHGDLYLPAINERSEAVLAALFQIYKRNVIDPPMVASAVGRAANEIGRLGVFIDPGLEIIGHPK